ncbi:MAG: hypothetical protein U0414_22540 [Polyangiaceae bacterium]
MSRALHGAVLALLATSTACSLIDLDALQSGVSGQGGGASGTTTSASTGASSSVGTTTSTSASSSTSAQSSGSTSTGGCADAFCDNQVGLDACADFDSAAHTLGGGWNSAISLSGSTKGTVTTSGADFASCPTSAVVDIVGAPGDRSWVQVAHTLGMGGKTRSTFSAKLNRSGPNGVAVDGAGLLEVAYDVGAGAYCQLYLQLYDSPGPGAYVFLQEWTGTETVQLASMDLVLPSPTANAWADVKLALDWSLNAKTVSATIDGVSKSFALPAACGPLPPSVTAGWGVAYEDKSQTVRLDDLTARSE